MEFLLVAILFINSSALLMSLMAVQLTHVDQKTLALFFLYEAFCSGTCVIKLIAMFLMELCRINGYLL